MEMVIWPLLIVNLRFLGLIWRGTSYFFQNNDIQQTTNELPDVGAKLEAWKLKMFNFLIFTVNNLIWFLEFQMPSPEYLMQFPGRKVAQLQRFSS